MIKEKRKNSNAVRIDLMGQQGNAYVLLGIAEELAELQAYTPEATQKLLQDMMSSDYNNLVALLEMNFSPLLDIEADTDLLEEIATTIDRINDERKEECGIARPLGQVRRDDPFNRF